MASYKGKTEAIAFSERAPEEYKISKKELRILGQASTCFYKLTIIMKILQFSVYRCIFGIRVLLVMFSRYSEGYPPEMGFRSDGSIELHKCCGRCHLLYDFANWCESMLRL